MPNVYKGIQGCYLRHLLQHLYYEHRIDYKKNGFNLQNRTQKNIDKL